MKQADNANLRLATHSSLLLCAVRLCLGLHELILEVLQLDADRAQTHLSLRTTLDSLGQLLF